MMTSKTVQVRSLHANPHRDFDLNPPDENRIKSLMDSIDRNDLWRGIVVRKNPDGAGYQLAFGHHRLEAIKRLNIKSIDVDIADLSDAQMLQYLSDENLNQGGKSPAAIKEIVVKAIFLLEGYLAEAQTPEEFCEWANITTSATGGEPSFKHPAGWTQIKNAGTVGRDILRAYLCPNVHSKGWSNEDIQIGINHVKAERAYEKAKTEKEAAQKEFEEKVGKVTPEEEEGIQERLEKAEQDRKEGERLKGYNDIANMFPHAANAAAFVRELANHYPKMPKSDQIRFARKIIENGTGKRDIPRVLGELVKGKKEWEKEVKRREKEKATKKKTYKDNWKSRWTMKQKDSLDDFLRGGLGDLEKVKTLLRDSMDFLEYVEDPELLEVYIREVAEIGRLANAIAGGLVSSPEIEIN